MPATRQSACGKFILVGEHAVVYGQPAIALPLSSRRISVRVEPLILGPSGKIQVIFPALGLDTNFESLPENHPIYQAILGTLNQLGIQQQPSCLLHYNAQLPIGSGLGSSAAMAVATIRGLSQFLGHPFENEIVNRLSYECEKHVHANPSGLDNTVITYEKAVFFRKGNPFEFLDIGGDFHFILANSGIQKSTKESVAQLAKLREEEPEFVNLRLEEIGKLALGAREALTEGDQLLLAEIINRNHVLLRELELSCPELEHLISLAMEAGASAAKLTGGGKGGHMIALVEAGRVNQVLDTMIEQAALNPFQTVVKASNA